MFLCFFSCFASLDYKLGQVCSFTVVLDWCESVLLAAKVLPPARLCLCCRWNSRCLRWEADLGADPEEITSTFHSLIFLQVSFELASWYGSLHSCTNTRMEEAGPPLAGDFHLFWLSYFNYAHVKLDPFHWHWSIYSLLPLKVSESRIQPSRKKICWIKTRMKYEKTECGPVQKFFFLSKKWCLAWIRKI